MPSTHTETFTTSDGCEIAYTRHATRVANHPRLALIHSLALDASIWDGVVAVLADRVDVLTYDCRGHGRSDRRASSFTVDLFARDLAQLFDRVGWQTAGVAGCSMGGNVAQAFAATVPARITALGLIDTTSRYGDDAPERWRERADTARSKGFGSLVDFQMARWLGDEFRAAHPDVARALTEVFLANDLDAYAASCGMLGEADSRPFLRSFRIPTAVIVGEEDAATPVSSARQLHDAIEGSTLTILPAARHLTPVECPDQIAAALITLLERSSALTATIPPPDAL